MLRKVFLHGALGEQFGVEHRLDIDTAAEAVRAFCVNIPEFMGVIREGSYHLVRGVDLETGISLDERMALAYRLGNGDLHIAPCVEGSKNGGGLKAVLGVALIGIAFVFSGGAVAGLAGAVPGLGGAISWGNVAMFGAVLAISGVAQMLSPEKKEEKSQDSFLMNGPGNAYEQGLPIPLVYGEVITGGLLVSGDMDIEEIPVNS